MINDKLQMIKLNYLKVQILDYLLQVFYKEQALKLRMQNGNKQKVLLRDIGHLSVKSFRKLKLKNNLINLVIELRNFNKF